MSSQRTIPYWDAIKIAVIRPAKGKRTVPKMTRRLATESSSACSMIECWESELDPLGSVSVVVQFVTVGFTRMTGSVRVVSVRVVSVTDAMKRFLSVGLVRPENPKTVAR